MLEIFKGTTLVLGGYSVYISISDGNPAQAIFRGILSIFAYKSMGKLINEVKVNVTNTNLTNSSGGKYQEASWFERIFKREANVNELKANPLDEFSDPKIGPIDTAISKYIKEINKIGKLSEPIEVQKLVDGGYEIVNGHHRWTAAIRAGLEHVPIRIKNYNN